MKKFIFDIDGTLTPSRQKIDPEFKTFMIYFAIKNPVYLVTGSDRQKTLEQIGAGLYDSCKRVYNCSGSDVYEADKNVYRDIWELPKKVEKFLEDELAYSCFPIRNGVHIERRPGQVNFSILGRGKDPSVGREEYIKWDTERLEREDILDRLKNAFPDLAMTLGGQTGIDIGPKGSDKSQILRDFDKDDELHFFGDKMQEGGNDYSLAMAIASNMMGEAYNVEDFTETWRILSKY
jgi:phosphomannomutase